MTQSTPPEVRVGQIWQCLEQSYWARVTRIDPPGTAQRTFHIEYITGQITGGLAHRRFSEFDGTGYPASTSYLERKLVRVIYDPEDQ